MRRAMLLLALLPACSKSSGSSPASSFAAPSAALPPALPRPTSARATDRFPTSKGELVVTPLEHASVLFEWNGKAIYVDPTSSAVADPALPKADAIFITDLHPDHLDPAAIDRLRRAATRVTPATIVVGPQAVADQTKVDLVMKNGDTRPVGDVVATAVPMYNLKRGPAPGRLYHDQGRGNGYELELGGLHVYLSGDTECTPWMKALEHIDVAFVCMNLPYTMPPAEAAACVAAFKPRVLFPYHYRGSDLGELDRDLADAGVEIRERQWYPAPPDAAH